MEFLDKFIEQWLISLPCANDFERGFYSALVLAVLLFFLLFLFCLILKLIFRKPAVPGVTLGREDGDIFISRNAIFTAVRNLERDFSELEILKVVMKRNRRKELELAITLLYDARESSFDVVAGLFKQRVFTMLEKSFGIDSVKSVSINLAKIPEDRGDDDDSDAGEAALANNAFISGV